MLHSGCTESAQGHLGQFTLLAYNQSVRIQGPVLKYPSICVRVAESVGQVKKGNWLERRFNLSHPPEQKVNLPLDSVSVWKAARSSEFFTIMCFYTS